MGVVTSLANQALSLNVNLICDVSKMIGHSCAPVRKIFDVIVRFVTV